MNVLKSMLALTALLFAASAVPAMAAPDSQSIFELLQGKAYDEIYSTLDNRGRSTPGTTITCLAANSSENCDLDYYGFTANDLNGDGSSVVGSVSLSNQDSQGRFDQAAVWDTASSKFVLLEDHVGLQRNFNAESPLADPAAGWDLSLSDFIETHSLEYSTFANDISTGSQTIVGTAFGRVTVYCDCSNMQSDFAFPLLWSPNGSGWDVATVLPFVLSEHPGSFAVGWANAISDAIAPESDMEYVAGAIGLVDGNSSEVVDLQAALWTHTAENGWAPRLLESNNFSGAEDVNDLGQVVGWAGNLRTINDFGLGWGVDGSPDWSPSAYIWLPDGGYGGHYLSDVDQSETTYDVSDATAIANDGSVAVGWVAATGAPPPPTNPPCDLCRPDNAKIFDPSPNAAAWIAYNPTWTEGEDRLINLQTELSSSATSGSLGNVEGSLVGSMAEGVDQHGRVVVGKGFYTDGTTDFTSALYWELDSGGQVVASGNLEQALAAAGVPMDGKDLTLTDARAVRVVYDTDGNPTDVYITGTGKGSFGSWIATLSGITTPDSIGKGPKVVKKATDDVASVLGGIADDQYCRRPTGTSVSDAPWCYFVVGVAGGEISKNAYGLGLAKTVGIAKYTDESTSFGATGGLSVSHGHVEGGSNYTALTATVGAYADHSPETGLQGRASIVLGRIIDATFNRVYVNGASTSTSTGSTSGFGAGFFGRVGYASSLDEATRTIPFVEVRLATVNLDAFTDTGGTFNGSFDATSQTSGSIRIGVDAEHALNAQTLLTGGVSVTAAGTTGTGVNATIAAQQFGVSGTGFAAYASGNIGVIYQIDATSSFTGQATGFVGLNGLVGGSVLAKYSKVF